MPVQDRTEPATPRRREEAREEGRVAKSTDLNSALVLFVSLIVLRVAGPYMFGTLMSMTRAILANLHTGSLDDAGIRATAISCASVLAAVSLPILVSAGAVGVASNVLQVGFRVSSKPMIPDINRMDPIKGFMRLVSWRGLVELIKSCGKVAIVGYVVYACLKTEYPNLLKLSDLPAPAASAQIGGVCWRLLSRACAATFILAILDYMYQRLQYEISLRMTKHEVKEEFKRSEGDPQVKARIRRRQIEMRRSRMVQMVPKADVVVTNPTHIAVALEYDASRMSAPTVIAKGQCLLAERIKAIAEAHGIPIVENVEVARLLYRLVEVGQQIPEELYQAVAEILAFVYRLSQKAGRRRLAS